MPCRGFNVTLSRFIGRFCGAIITLLTCAVSPAAAQTPPLCQDAAYGQVINQLWDARRPQYAKWAENSRTQSVGLYNIQGEAYPLWRYTRACGDRALQDKYMSVLMGALDGLQMRSRYTFYYRTAARKSVDTLPAPTRLWVNGDNVGEESVLHSAQFLGLIAEVAADVATDKANGRAISRTAQDFLTAYHPVLKSHYRRWVLSRQGVFQVRGWGCTVGGTYVPGDMNHAAYLRAKLSRNLGDSNAPSYCNAVLDQDLWIITGVAHMLAIDSLGVIPTRLTQSQRGEFTAYLSTAYTLINDRLSYDTATGFDGRTVRTAQFDLGAFDDHKDMAQSARDDLSHYKPTKFIRERRAQNTGMDLSHASRFVPVFEALSRHRSIVGASAPNTDTIKALSHQITTTVFNGDFTRPLFANFWDGSNGWHRVGYSGRAGFGYPPHSYSSAMLYGGYGLWARDSDDIASLYRALMGMLLSDSRRVRRHVQDHYEQSYFQNRKRVKNYDLTPFNPMSAPELYITLLPSLVYLN